MYQLVDHVTPNSNCHSFKVKSPENVNSRFYYLEGNQQRWADLYFLAYQDKEMNSA